MGRSDANAQCRSYYSADTQSVCYWWPLFQLLLDASVLNAFNIWKLHYPHSILSHVDFQHTIALNFTQTPLAMGRKYAPRLKIGGSNPMVQPPTHHFIRIDKKTYYHVCRARAKLQKKARTALAPIDGNQLVKRTRPPQTTWGTTSWNESWLRCYVASVLTVKRLAGLNESAIIAFLNYYNMYW